MAQADEQEWLIRAKQGDTVAFAELVGRYQTAVFNIAYRFLGNRQDAEDAAQEAFVRAFRAMDRFDTARPFAPWIKRIAANHCLNRLQKAVRHTQITASDLQTGAEEVADMDNWAHTVPTPEQTMVRQQETTAIHAAILQLPPRYWAVIELRHFQQMAYDEIAATLERPLSSVKSDLFRARRMLAEMLKERK